jgi:DNA-binding beta-propeller fold protein YncE
MIPKVFVAAAALIVLTASLAAGSAFASYNYVSQFGSSGSGNGQFQNPIGVAVAPSGDVYVVDTSNNRVQKFDPSGNYLSQFGSAGSGNAQFSFPYGVAVDPVTSAVYVTDTSNNRVEKFDAAGNYLSQFGSFGSGDGQFSTPIGVAVDSSGGVYVVDSSNSRVQKFDSAGNYLSQFGSSGTGNGQFDQPHGVAVGSGGAVYVSDGNNSRVEKFDSAGTYLSQFGSLGSGDGQLNNPYLVTVDSSGNVYVADTGNTRVEKFDSAGNYLSQFGSFGSGNGQFGQLRGVAVNSAGEAFVPDFTGNRVEKFAPTPPVVTTGAASNVSATAARLNATVNIQGSGSYRFDYGTSTAYGTTTPAQTATADTQDHPVSADVSGLTPGTTYHFRVIATNQDGSTAGADQAFTTSPSAPAPAPASATPTASGATQTRPTAAPAPVITSLSVNHRCVRGVTLTTPTAGTGGLSFTYTVSQDATMTYEVLRRAGSPRWRACPKRGGKKPSSYSPFGALKHDQLSGGRHVALGTTAAAHRTLRHPRLHRGPHQTSLAHTTAGRHLSPGTYLLRVSATNANGRSNIATVKFWVIGQAKAPRH